MNSKSMASSVQLIIVIATLTSCAQEGQSLETEGESEPQVLLQDSNEPLTEPANKLMLVKEGSIRFFTTDPDRTLSQIKEATEAFQGYIAEERSAMVLDDLQYFLKIRVPSIHFDKLLARIEEQVGQLEDKRADVKDVTEEFVDLGTRIQSKKNLHKRYTDLLSEAKGISQILELEKVLEKVQSEVEKMEGRLVFLQNRVSYSVLELSFFSKRTSNSTLLSSRLTAGFEVGLNGALTLLIGLVHIWPMLVAGSLTVLFYRLRKRLTRTLGAPLKDS